MRLAIHISLLLLSCLPISCVNDWGISFSLDMAEKVIHAHPDSALIILQKIDKLQIPTRALQARYALLYTQALDKNYLPLSGDSLINIAIDYYSHKKDYRRLGWAYLYQGNVYVEIDSITQAMNAYIKAEEMLQSVQDDYLLGLITNNIAELYLEERNYERALILFRQSLSAFQRVENRKNEGYILSQIGDLHYIAGSHIDSVLYYDDKAIEIAIMEDDLEFLYLLLVSRVAILRELKEYTQARELLYSITNKYKQGIIPLDGYPLLSLVYIDLKQLDSARYYMQLLLQDARATAKQRAGAFAILKNVEEQAGNFQTALHYADLHKTLSDSIVQALYDRSLQYTEQSYHLEKLAKKHLVQKIWYLVAIICLGILAIACVFGIQYLWKRRLAHQRRQHEEVVAQQKESMKAFRRSFLSENWNVALFLKEFESGSLFPTEDVFLSKAHSMANLACPGLIAWLENRYPQLNKSDTVLTCLLFIGIKPKRLCTLFQVQDLRTMHTRCSRLYQKLGIKTDPKNPLWLRDRIMDLWILDKM